MGKKSRKKKQKRFDEANNNHAPQSTENTSANSIEKICLLIIRWALYALLFSPLIVGGKFFFPFVGPKGLYIMGLIQVIFFVWLFLAICLPKYRPQKNPLLIALIVFLTVLTLATVFGQDPLRSFWSKFERATGLLMWFHFFALFLAATNTIKKIDWMKVFAISIFVACIVSFLFLIAPEGSIKFNTANFGSTLGNSSFLATYLLFNLYFAIYLFISALKGFLFRHESAFSKASLAVLSVIIILFFGVLFKCGGEGAFLASLGGLGLIFLLWLAKETKKEKLRKLGKLALVAGILIFILGVTLLHVPGGFVQGKLIEMRNMARPLVWHKAWQGFSERPILGWGPQNFSMPFDKHFDPCFYTPICGSESRFDQAHNIIMDNLVDAGVLGLLGYFFILGSFFFILWKAHAKKRLNFWTSAIFTGLIIAHFTQNLFVFDMPVSYLMMFLVLSFALRASQEKKETNAKPLSSKGLQSALCIILLILFIITFNFFVARPRAAGSGMIQVLITKEAEAKKQAYDRALNSSPTGLYQIRTHLATNLSSRLQKIEPETDQELIIWEIQLLTQELEESIKSSPLDYYSYVVLGTLYNDAGAVFQSTEIVLKAEKVLKTAIALSPKKQAAYWELAKSQAMLAQSMPEKKQESIKHAQTAVDLEPKLEYSHLYLLNILNIFEESELLKQKIEEAIQAIPEIESKIKQSLPQGT